MLWFLKETALVLGVTAGKAGTLNRMRQSLRGSCWKMSPCVILWWLNVRMGFREIWWQAAHGCLVFRLYCRTILFCVKCVFGLCWLMDQPNPPPPPQSGVISRWLKWDSADIKAAITVTELFCDMLSFVDKCLIKMAWTHADTGISKYLIPFLIPQIKEAFL